MLNPCCCRPRDCLSCIPNVVDDSDLPKYCYSTIDGLSWGMPELATGSLGPWALSNQTFGSIKRWNCPDWHPGLTGGIDSQCGTVIATDNTIDWRVDTLDVDNFNGLNQGVRVNPDSNKCYWTWYQGRVLNIYSRGAAHWCAAWPGTSLVSVEPKFHAEAIDMVPGTVEGTIVDPGTDGLTGYCTADPGPNLRPCNDTYPGAHGTPGWRRYRFKYGVSWQLNAQQVDSVWRWVLTGSATWSYLLRATTKYATGTLAGHYCLGIGGGWGRAGVWHNYSPATTGPPSCFTGNNSIGAGGTTTADIPTEEIVRNLPTTPASSPSGHRLYRGGGVTTLNYNNQLRFQYASDDPIACQGDLFNFDVVQMSLLPGISDVDLGYFAGSYGLSLPATMSIQFSNS